MPIEHVSTLLGHKNVKVTEEHYLPWVKARHVKLEQAVEVAHRRAGTWDAPSANVIFRSGSRAHSDGNNSNPPLDADRVQRCSIWGGPSLLRILAIPVVIQAGPSRRTARHRQLARAKLRCGFVARHLRTSLVCVDGAATLRLLVKTSLIYGVPSATA
jgi:hypothetical protein